MRRRRGEGGSAAGPRLERGSVQLPAAAYEVLEGARLRDTRPELGDGGGPGEEQGAPAVTPVLGRPDRSGQGAARAAACEGEPVGDPREPGQPEVLGARRDRVGPLGIGRREERGEQLDRAAGDGIVLESFGAVAQQTRSVRPRAGDRELEGPQDVGVGRRQPGAAIGVGAPQRGPEVVAPVLAGLQVADRPHPAEPGDGPGGLRHRVTPGGRPPGQRRSGLQGTVASGPHGTRYPHLVTGERPGNGVDPVEVGITDHRLPLLDDHADGGRPVPAGDIGPDGGRTVVAVLARDEGRGLAQPVVRHLVAEVLAHRGQQVGAQHLRHAEPGPGLGGHDDAPPTEIREQPLAVPDAEQAVAEVAGQRVERCGALEEDELLGGEPGQDGLRQVFACVAVATAERAHRAVSHLGSAAGDGVAEELQGGGPSAGTPGEDPGVGVAERQAVAVAEQLHRLGGPEPQVRGAKDRAGELRAGHVDRGRRPAADHQMHSIVGGQHELLERSSDILGAEVVEVVDHEHQRRVAVGADVREPVPVGCPSVLRIGGVDGFAETVEQRRPRIDRVLAGPEPGDVHRRSLRPLGETRGLARARRRHDRADPRVEDAVERRHQPGSPQTRSPRDAHDRLGPMCLALTGREGDPVLSGERWPMRRTGRWRCRGQHALLHVCHGTSPLPSVGGSDGARPPRMRTGSRSFPRAPGRLLPRRAAFLRQVGLHMPRSGYTWNDP